MLIEALSLDNGKGKNIDGQNISNIIMQRTQSYWQRVSNSQSGNSFNMVDKLDATSEQYGMLMIAKRHKMIVEKTPWKQCEVGQNVKGRRLTQVKEYKYMDGKNSRA